MRSVRLVVSCLALTGVIVASRHTAYMPRPNSDGPWVPVVVSGIVLMGLSNLRDDDE